MGFFKRVSRGMMASPIPRGASNARAYIVGDIHGRLDLLHDMLTRIAADTQGRAPRRTFVIFLGDLVDRGPQSAAVVETLRNYSPHFGTPVFLSGNHEEVFVRLLRRERGILASWLKFGGAECAASYGVDPTKLAQIGEEAALDILARTIPVAHLRFLEGFADTFRFGDYLCVHAGIRPGIAIEDQSHGDLRWIRDPFLNDGKEHGFVVVHGHTIVDAVEERPNRIAIDTGAYRTGNLTALAIEDDRRWTLSTAQSSASPP